MGATPFPADLILRLAGAHCATAFVETGTFHGATARWAAEHFDVVHTIELGDRVAPLSDLKNVTVHWGDSRTVLPMVVESLGGRRVVFYLDAHWSGGDTAGEEDQCPLLGELTCVTDRDVIFIDDARLFSEGAVKFPPLDPKQWPTYDEVLYALPIGMEVRKVGDVIVAVPACLGELL